MHSRLLITLLLAVATRLAATSADNFVKDPEPAILEVRYTRTQVNDTAYRDSLFIKGEMMLRIGREKSLFCSVKRLFKDSITAVDNDAYWAMMTSEMDKGNPHVFSTIGGNINVYLYKNYPEGMVTETAYFDLEDWIYSEPWEKPVWEISDDSKEILGYPCVRATTDYRGRHWTAWFTPDIPLQEGPWKLCGLPGLILEAYDSDLTYSFTAEGLMQDGIGDVGFMGYSSHRTPNRVTRDRYFNNWWKYKHSDMGAKVGAALGVDTTTQPVRKKRGIRYDKEETDYPHDL